MMKSNYLIIMAIAVFSSSSIAYSQNNEYDYQAPVGEIQDWIKDLKPPYHLFNPEEKKNGTEFDVMSYFRVLKNISIPEGRILDYVYRMEGSAGYPILYTRSSSEGPFENFNSYQKRHKYINTDHIIKSIVTEIKIRDTAAGYFEYAVFYFYAPKFYLYKSARNDRRIISDQNSLDEVLKDSRLPDEFKVKAKKINPVPVITLEKDHALVKILTFTAWGGFYREHYTIKRSFPHTLIKQNFENLVHYNCGIKFK